MALFNEAAGTTDQILISAAADLWLRLLNATPADGPDRPVMLSNLGVLLQRRFELTGELANLDAAIDAEQAAVAAIPPSDPRQARCLSNLGNALRIRFGQTGALADLDAAIKAGQAAVDATPHGNPDRALTRSSTLTNPPSAWTGLLAWSRSSG